MTKSAKSTESQSGMSRRQLLAGSTATAVVSLSPATSSSQQMVACNIATKVKSRRSYETALKNRATNDYRQSMRRFGGQLSSDAEELFSTSMRDPHQQLDIVIIGSGYGASICAARLARHIGPGVRLAIIERGREWVPGTFADHPRGLPAPPAYC